MLAILSFSGSKFKDLKRIGWKIKLHLKKKIFGKNRPVLICSLDSNDLNEKMFSFYYPYILLICFFIKKKYRDHSYWHIGFEHFKTKF